MSSPDEAASGWPVQGSPDESWGIAPFLMFALGLHALVALAQRHPLPTSAPTLPPLEMDLAVPTPARVIGETEPEPIERSAPAALVKRAPTASRSARAVTESPSGPAHAGNVLTAGVADHAGDAVSFVTDPSGGSYGVGVVAKGGSGSGASTDAPPHDTPKTQVPGSPGLALTPASDLSRRPTLEESDPCRGFFPSASDSDTGQVTLNVIVQPDGRIGSLSVLTETPSSQGFGNAARLCLSGKRFEPALDRSGRAVRTATQVRIKFSR